VLELIAEGLSNLAIADRLVVTDRAVEWHVTSIFGKLGLTASGQGQNAGAGGARLLEELTCHL
jgi:DNA-binding NarL/FixJ family response regulator